MIQADHLLAVTRRCELLDVARSTVYYRPTGISAEDLALMAMIRFGGHLPKGEYDVDHDGHEGQADAAELHG